MKEITLITAQKNKDDRLNVYLDEEFAFGVDYATAVKFGLEKGMLLSDETLAAIAKEESESAAFTKGLKYAVKKTVSKKQMSDYLLKHDFSPEVAELTLQKLAEYGYIDDEHFTKAYISTYKDYGIRRIKLGLKQAGIDDELIERHTADLIGTGACEKCVEKYLRTHKEPDKQKLISYLTYRGFVWEEIEEAISGSELWK